MSVSDDRTIKLWNGEIARGLIPEVIYDMLMSQLTIAISREEVMWYQVVFTFRYREIDPGSSVLADDIAIITGVIYNAKHELKNDTMVKAQEEGRLEEFLQVQKNNREWQNKILSLGLQIPIEEVEETITHPVVRARLVYAIRGGAVPRLSTDAPTDVDTFPEQVEGQEPTETASEGGST